jgi:hypothetical protein
MTDLSVFNKKGNSNLTLSTDVDNQNESSGISGFFGKLKSYIPTPLSSNDQEAQAAPQEDKSFFYRTIDTVKGYIEVEKSYKLFLLFLSIGIGLLFFSLFFLPFVLFSPGKFVSLFSLGSIVTLSSFIFLYGTSGFLTMLFSRERLLFTMLFISSLVLGLYFAFVQSNYIISLVLSVTQLVTLIIFMLSFIPGGQSGISFISGMLLMPLESLWYRIRGSS